MLVACLLNDFKADLNTAVLDAAVSDKVLPKSPQILFPTE